MQHSTRPVGAVQPTALLMKFRAGCEDIGVHMDVDGSGVLNQLLETG